MDHLHTKASAEADRQLNERLNEIESHDETPEAVSVKFRARVDEYQLESLDRSDAQEAVFGALNAKLIAIAEHNGNAILSAMESGTVNIMDSPELGRAINTHVALVRQAGHLANTAARLAELREKAMGQRNSRHFGSTGTRPVTRRTAR